MWAWFFGWRRGDGVKIQDFIIAVCSPMLGRWVKRASNR